MHRTLMQEREKERQLFWHSERSESAPDMNPQESLRSPHRV